jgi:outer membrane protein insertion porin family
MLRTTKLLTLILASTLVGAAAQTKNSLQVLPKKFRIASITVMGSQIYSAPEIVAASGLKINTEVTPDDLQAASNVLGTSGAFSNVQYRYTPGSGNQVSVEFHVIDSNHWLPVIFQNVVWFTREEIFEQLHSRFPLFKGNLPQAGDLNEQVRGGLEQMIAAKGIPAKVVMELQAEQAKTVDAVIFRAEGVKVTIAAVNWKNVQKLDPAVLGASVKPLIGAEYQHTYVRSFLTDNIRLLYLARGFLKARIADHEVQVNSASPTETLVGIVVPVEEGPSYRFKGVTWSGNTVFPTSELAKLVQLKPGETANPIALQQQIVEARRQYGRRGYLGVKLKVQARLYEDQSADFEIEINEGQPYRLGKLQIRGLDAERTQKLLAVWKLPEGSTYDEGYADQFGLDALRVLPNRRWIYTKQEMVNDQTKTVDLTMDFKPSL